MRKLLPSVLLFVLSFNISFAAVHDVSSIGTKSEGDRFQASDFNNIIDTITSFFQDDSDNSIGINEDASGDLMFDANGKIGATEVCDSDGNNCSTTSALATVTGGDGTSTGIPTYTDASTRDTAIPSPVEGQTVYMQDSDTVYVYDGSGWGPIYTETDPNVETFAKTILPTCGVGEILKGDGTNLSCVPDDNGGTASLSSATDSNITGVTGTNFLIYDGIDSWDNYSLSGDVTVTTAGVVSITAGVIGNTQLADNSVTSAKIQDGSVTAIDLADTYLTSETDPNVETFAKTILPTCGVGEILKGDGTNLSCVPDDTGIDTFLAQTDTPASYTAGSVLFTSSGAVVDENGGLYWDTVSGRLGIGTSTPSDTVTVAGNIVPTIDNTYTLGTPSQTWQDIYVGPNSLHIGGLTLSNISGSLKWNSQVLMDASGVKNIAADAVGNTQLADNAVTSNKILDGTITAADLADTYLTSSNINTLALATLSCSESQIAKYVSGTWQCSSDADSGGSTDTLDDVTNRGTTTTNSITVGALVANNTITGSGFVGDGSLLTNISFPAISTNAIQDAEIDYTKVTLMDFTNDAGFITSSSGGGKFVDGLDVNDAVYTDGNVGVGTTSPTETLEVVGNIKTTGEILITEESSGKPSFYVGSYGWVGIGTTNPGGTFRVVDSEVIMYLDGSIGNDPVQLYFNSGVNVGPHEWLGSISFLSQDSTNYGSMYTFIEDSSTGSEDGSFIFETITAGSTKKDSFYISGSGIGIGTTSPSTALDVNGQIKITGGTPGAGKVLTSDSNGLATWETSTTGTSENSITLSAEYPGATLYADSSDNLGTMTSDNTGSSNNWMNYYEWTSSETTLNDYDVVVRFTIPNDFSSWKTNAITLDYVTATNSNTDNKVDLIIYEETSDTADTTDTANVSSTGNVWTTTTISDSSLTGCNVAGETCIAIIRMYSKDSNAVKIGDLKLDYNK